MSDLAQKYNPLEDGRMAEVIPAVWNGSHAGKRLAEAFKVLAMMPGGAGAARSAWPTYALDELPKPDDEPPRTRVRASAADISHMEQAISWPGRYLVGDAGMMRVVQIIAIARAFERDEEAVCKRRGWYLPTVLRKNRRGLQLIAEALNRDRVDTW